MKIFIRYVIELAIIIPDAFYIFLPVLDDLRWKNWFTFGISAILLPIFIVLTAWISAKNMMPIIPVLIVSVLFLFIIFSCSVKISLGRKLFCFFNSIMLGAFCLLYSIVLMASLESENEIWEITDLLTIESGLVSLGISILIGCALFKVLTKELSTLLKEEHINGIWDFLFLVPCIATLLISWLKPIEPKNLMVGRLRVKTLVMLLLIPLVVLLIYYLLYWITNNFSESAKLQNENTLLQMEGKRYEELRRYLHETSTLRHDFRQHFLVIQKLTDSGELDELKKYLSQFSEKVLSKKYTGYCDNSAIDAMASYYTEIAESQRTKINWKLKLPSKIPIKESDFCAMLGNLIENALKAVKELPEEKRYVNVISSMSSEIMIVLSVDNPFNSENFPEKEIRIGEHGIGLASIKNTVKRHNGIMHIKTNENVFAVEILLHANNNGGYCNNYLTFKS